MTTPFRPMKPVKVPVEALFSTGSAPLLATPKIDGIRCVLLGGRALTSTLKPVPNLAVRTALETRCGSIGLALDGELVVPDATFSETCSAVMSQGGSPLFRFMVFDVLNDFETYAQRVTRLAEYDLPGWCQLLLPQLICDVRDAQLYLDDCLERKLEGAVFRSQDAFYKHGRSTLRERGMLAVKPFVDAEARVVGFDELMSNQNEPQLNALGLTERGSAHQGQVPMGTLGALVVQLLGSNDGSCQLQSGTVFSIGTGFTSAERSEIWLRRDAYLNRICTFKYLPHDVKDAPRHPVFLRWRDALDVPSWT